MSYLLKGNFILYRQNYNAVNIHFSCNNFITYAYVLYKYKRLLKKRLKQCVNMCVAKEKKQIQSLQVISRKVNYQNV